MQNGVSITRPMAAFVAAVGWFALAVQLIVSIRLGIDRGSGWPYGVWMYVAFFTVFTNLLVAVAATLVALAPTSRHGRTLGDPNALTGIAANIILVGATYNLILAGLWHPHGWQLVADIALHDAVPVLFVGFWWIAVPRGAIILLRAAIWAIYPVLYFFYAMIRGFFSGFYPYPFLNVSRLGIGMVIVNALGVLLAFFVILGLLAVLKRRWRA